MRFRVSPVRGPATANFGRDGGGSASFLGDRFVRAVAGVLDGRKLGAQTLERRVSLDMRGVISSRRPPTSPASVHRRNTAVKSCSNVEESAKRQVCA